jgi:hypothetical protein
MDRRRTKRATLRGRIKNAIGKRIEKEISGSALFLPVLFLSITLSAIRVE